MAPLSRVRGVSSLERHNGVARSAWDPELVIDYAQRRAWAHERARVGAAEEHLELSRHPAFARLPELTVAAMLLPPDPLAPALEFDDVFPAIPSQLNGQIRNAVSLLSSEELTGTHALRHSSAPYEGPAKFVAGVARHGGAIAGAGSPGIYQARGEPPQRIYRLFVIVAVVRAALVTQAAVIDRLGAEAGLPDGPWELTVAMPGGQGAWLGAYAPGWHPVEHLDSPPMCMAANPVVRLEIDHFPTDRDGIGSLLEQAMSRVVNIFGTAEPLYADARNVSAGIPTDY